MNLSMKYSIGLYGALCLLARLSGCEELDHSISEDPYGGGKVQFELRLLSEDPVPAKGYPGDTVVFKADGLLDYCVPEKGNMLLNSIWENRKPKYWLPPIRR